MHRQNHKLLIISLQNSKHTLKIIVSMYLFVSKLNLGTILYVLQDVREDEENKLPKLTQLFFSSSLKLELNHA